MSEPTLECSPHTRGMNRAERHAIERPISVPRTRGDEPGSADSGRTSNRCSPHTRG